MKNIIEKIKRFFYRLYSRSYGMDDINKYLLIGSLVLSLIDLLYRNVVTSTLSMILMIVLLLRYFSTKKYARSEENRKFRKYIKYIKMKWEYRKTHKIFMCKNCGQLIRVPKGKGKIVTTCPSCGSKENHRS